MPKHKKQKIWQIPIDFFVEADTAEEALIYISEQLGQLEHSKDVPRWEFPVEQQVVREFKP
ncbi:MAG TPA: hypothetical protein VJ742_12615 [Nitrososphaera sp.]|nr:hypothetical protein [Nitrososphaera sp.]